MGLRLGHAKFQPSIRGIHRVRLNKNHWPWMTLKVVTRYCG